MTGATKRRKRPPAGWRPSMTYRQYISEVIAAAAPRFDGRDAERRSWMLDHLQHYEKHREEIEAREAGRD